MTGKELKDRVDLLGLAQRKLAEKMGVTPQTVNAILTAKDIRTSTIERIASVTGMPISFFFNEESDKQSAIVSGNGSVAVAGNNNVTSNAGDNAVLQERVKMLEKLLEDKERTIKILMEK